jgi:hypothetical protein
VLAEHEPQRQPASTTADRLLLVRLVRDVQMPSTCVDAPWQCTFYIRARIVERNLTGRHAHDLRSSKGTAHHSKNPHSQRTLSLLWLSWTFSHRKPTRSARNDPDRR